MWINPLGKPEPRVNWNKKFKEELKGELTDEKAISTLGKFLSFNIQFTVRILMGILVYTISVWTRFVFKRVIGNVILWA